VQPDKERANLKSTLLERAHKRIYARCSMYVVK